MVIFWVYNKVFGGKEHTEPIKNFIGQLFHMIIRYMAYNMIKIGYN